MSLDRMPSTLSLRYCTRCPRTDRQQQLKDKHYFVGKVCTGAVKVATYRLDRGKD